MPFQRNHIVFLISLLLFTSSCQMTWRSVRYNKPGLMDYELWEERSIEHPQEVHVFADGKAEGIPPIEEWAQGKWYKEGMDEARFFKKTGTAAFLVLRGDSLLYEYYDPKYSEETRFNSFSMSKPYIATLIGIAIGEGHISSIHQSVGDFIPKFADSSLCALKISNLLQMTSGIKARSSNGNPWGTTARLYYGGEGTRQVEKVSLERTPGTRWKYQNINIQILGMVLERATGMPPSQYLEEKIWQPLGMEADAGWSLHEDGETEKSFCCLNARTRDYARFGLLLLQDGQWKGRQLIPKDWLRACTQIDTAEGARQRYQNTFYTTVEQEDYFLQGLLGQYTYISPSTRTVIVRIGSKINPNVPWYDMFKYIAGLSVKPEPVELPLSSMEALEGTWTFGLSNFGDSLMWGKEAEISARKEGLRVQTNFNKTWIATPSSDSTFFNLKYARRLLVRYDKAGKVEKIRWTRRGNAWWMRRLKEGE